MLKLGAINGAGLRTYLAVQGGFKAPDYLGSKSTFTLGQFGGHGGRTLRAGDVLNVTPAHADNFANAKRRKPLASKLQSELTREWKIGVLYGPHGAPDFFTDGDIETFFATDWEIHYNSSRTGVRLIGPKPQWARTDGGEAGLHPSNIHDNAYAIGAVDFTGDMPVILGPDGPSLGGFVCPATIVQAELWKMGQLKPGDKVRFIRLTREQANAMQLAQDAAIEHLDHPAAQRCPRYPYRYTARCCAVAMDGDKPQVVIRQSGDASLLIEVGPLVLDLELRLRIQALMNIIKEQVAKKKIKGILDLTPGIRSLQIHFDPRVVDQDELISASSSWKTHCRPWTTWKSIRAPCGCHLSWDDPATKLAIEKYMQSVRPDAPWCPSNIEFIRRINGLKSISKTSTRSCSKPAIWSWAWATSISARRWPRHSTRVTVSSPPSTTRRAPGRRKTQSALAAPTCACTAWKAPAVTSSSAAPCRCGTATRRPLTSRSRGCCASSTRCVSIRSARMSCSSCAKTLCTASSAQD